ncbi:MAG: dienelactone hydrolase family protein [Longimicrobiales bacterium]|nr:dienelactone hydrolase family protein [Longimicrobiales bacterium]
MHPDLPAVPRAVLACALFLALIPAGALPAAAQEGSTASYDWIPPGADGAMEGLNRSPRHGEWAMVRLENGDSVRSWVVYPERSDPAPVVVVIHEIFGLTNWVRAVADRLAAEGFIAIAPDLLTMEDVPIDETGNPERQPAVAAIRGLDEDRVHAQIRAAAEFAMGLPAAESVYGITGFCWGGSTSFEHATRYDDIMGAVPFYGSSPDAAGLAEVRVPVLGHYGGDDERVNATIPRAEEALGGDYVANVYDGAGHGFLRQQSGRDGANLRASLQAWPMTVGFFRAAAFHAGGD